MRKYLKCVREEIGTRYEIKFIGVEQQCADAGRHPEVSADQQNRAHFQKNIFE